MSSEVPVETYTAVYTSGGEVEASVLVDLPYSLEDLLREHAKWDLRPPRADRPVWEVWPMYHPVTCGAEAKSLIDALQLSLARGLLVELYGLTIGELRTVRLEDVEAE